MMPTIKNELMDASAISIIQKIIGMVVIQLLLWVLLSIIVLLLHRQHMVLGVHPRIQNFLNGLLYIIHSWASLVATFSETCAMLLIST